MTDESRKTARPPWGLQRAVPEGATCSWGARALDNQGRSLDIVWDRQGFSDIDAPPIGVGERRVTSRERGLMNALNSERGINAAEQAMIKLADRNRWPLDGPTVLVDDGDLVIMADTQKSYGYVYMAAWLHSHIKGEGF